MNYEQYLEIFGQILHGKDHRPPYDNPVYLNYAKLGYSRMGRWWKTMHFSDAFKQAIAKIQSPQEWIIITEPWCGDAAPVVPAVVKIASLNPMIRYDIQLRDSEPFLINSYLTNGAKSIPKIIARDGSGNDVFTWGPRPEGAQQLVNAMKASGAPSDEVATALQNWYNKDKGASFQEEIVNILTSEHLGILEP